MKKQLLIAALSLSACSGTFAQLNKVDEVKKQLQTENVDTVAWVHSGVLTIGANTGFLHNWAAGGELGSLLVNGIFSGRLDRLNHRDIWSNNLDMTYGLTYNYSTAFIPRKTDDRIDFTSKYGMMLDTANNIFLTGLFNFKSQFTKGYDYSIPNWDSMSTSAFMSPAFFTTAIGFEYRKGSDISIFLSPIAARMITADKFYTLSNPEGMFGVPYGKTSVFQLGAYFSGRYTANISKKMIYKTRVDLYGNYLAKDTKDSTGKVIKKDAPTNINILFDNLFSWKVSKVVNITLGLTFMYDNNIPYSRTYTDAAGNEVPKNEPGEWLGWTQVKQVTTIGISYKF